MSGFCEWSVWAVAGLGLLVAIGGCQGTGARQPQFEEHAVSESELAKIEAETAELRRQAAALSAETERRQAEAAAQRAEMEELQRLIEQVRAGQEPAVVQPKDSGATRPAFGAESRPAPKDKSQGQAKDKPQDEQNQKADKQKEEARQARERQRKQTRLEAELGAAGLRLDKARLAAEHAELQFKESVNEAEKELAIAREKFKVFQDVTAPNRIARAELGLQMTEDGFQEAQEELDQLELMYSEDEFADKTKEIVIDRARRRLERSQRDVELRRSEYDTLVNVTIPQETADQEFDLEQKERALDKLRRERATDEIEQRVGVMTATAEIVKLENELADVREEIAEGKQAAESGT